MIRLSGKEPDRDVAIEFVGARPGDQLHEELVGDDEVAEPTSHPKILRVTRPGVDPAWLDERLRELERLVDEGDTLQTIARLAAIVADPKRAPAPSTAGRV
jgi:FlaA1/EpsC-like NDP-sugar epimerase